MDTINVDGLSPGNSESGENMEDRQSVEENETEDCMEYRGKPYTELTLDDLSNVEFRTVDEVDKFYSYYSLAKGFSMRKHRYDKNCAGTVILCRQLVCSRQGQRRENGEEEAVIDKPWLKGKNVLSPQFVQKPKDICGDSCGGSKRISCENVNTKPRKHTRRLTRGNCQASLRVRLCKERGVYYASEFITDHNHDLTRVEHRHFLRSHRKVKDSDIASVLSMRKVSVKTSCAYELLVHVAGGYEFVGFTIRDLYNKLKEARAEIILDSDAQSSVTWMTMKAMRDPHFYCIFSVDQSGRLANTFWHDGQSLVDYNPFGEILIFDSTYKSNIYGKPLAVFVGCNNHRATVIYGCALLVDETEETYLWLLSSF